MQRSFTLVLLFALSACDGGGPTTIFDDTAAELPPKLVIDEESIDFGYADDVGRVVAAQLTVQNLGEGTLDIEEIFSIGPFYAGSTTLTVNPSSTTQISVYFDPETYDEAVGVLTILSNDPDAPEVEINLSGRVVVDGDSDGYIRSEAGGDDCDDEDADFNPGQEENWYDGRDQDCAGDDDYDQDADGYQTIVYNTDAANGGGDCNDVVASIYPGAEDTWYDGVDSNCGGESDWDADEDGYNSAALQKGSDCNDYDADMYPGADERLNGDLDDCNGVIDSEMGAGAADLYWTGDEGGQRYGRGLTVLDMDDDGMDDIIVSAPDYDSSGASFGRGAISIYLTSTGYPSSGSDLQDGYHMFYCDSSACGLGESLASVWDWEGSGTGEASIAMGAPGSNSCGGAIYLVAVDDLRTWGDTGNRHTEIRGTTSYGYYLGSAMSEQLDMDGDGSSDLLFGYASGSSANSYVRLGLQYGGQTGIINLSQVDATWYTNTSTADPTRENASAGHDLDGDGLVDWVFSDANDDTSATNGGSVWVLWGSSTRYSTSSNYFYNSAEHVASAESEEGGGYAAGLLPDMDGDGSAELAWWVKDTGTLHLLSGAGLKGGGVHSTSDSFASVDFSANAVPSQIRSIGDWDDDGFAEWAISLDGASGSGAGEVVLFWGTGMAGDYDGQEEYLAYFKASSDDLSADFGDRIAPGGGDLDGDGRIDLVMSDSLWEGDMDGDGAGDEEVGAVYLFFNGGL